MTEPVNIDASDVYYIIRYELSKHYNSIECIDIQFSIKLCESLLTPTNEKAWHESVGFFLLSHPLLGRPGIQGFTFTPLAGV